MDAQHESQQERGRRMLKESGYAMGGAVDDDEAEDKALVKKGVSQHENQEHGGRHSKLKLRGGGHVDGKKSASRPDKRARGGAASRGVTVNVKGEDKGKEQMAAQAGMKRGLQAGVALGARQAASRMAGAAPGAGGPPGMGPRPPMGGPPMGGPPMPPPGAGGPPMKKGGKVQHVRVREHTRRKAGGRVEAC